MGFILSIYMKEIILKNESGDLQMKKKIIIFLVLVLVLGGTLNTYAQEGFVNEKEVGVLPLFTYITKHYVDISKGNGEIKCETILSFTGERAKITNTLQEQTDYGWEDVRSQSITYYTYGTKFFAPAFSGTSGKKYRFKSLVEIKDIRGNVLESSTVTSNYINY